MGVAVFRGKRSAELLFIVHAAPTAAEQLSQTGTQKRYRALPGSPGECTTPVRHCPRALPPNYNLPIPASGGSGGAAVGDELQGRHDDSQSNAAEVSDGAG